MATSHDLQTAFLDRRSEFVQQLRSLRIAANLTQPNLARQVGAGLSVNAYKKYEWRGGEALPDADRLDQIIEVLGPDAAALRSMRNEVEAARGAWRAGSDVEGAPGGYERYVPWEQFSLRDLERRSLEAIMVTCQHADGPNGPIDGWRQYLENDELPVTSIASSYGLRILLMANHAGAVPSIDDIRRSILTMEHESGGWSARTQSRELARVEAYGPVLHTLRLSGLPDDEFTKRVEHFEEILDPSFDSAPWLHTSIITIACDTLSAVHPESYRIPELLGVLASAVREDGSTACWTSSLDSQRAEHLSPSTAHTARAICSILRSPPEAGEEVRHLAIKAARWLEAEHPQANSSELIERGTENGSTDFLSLRHFTAAWVGHALSLASSWTEIRPQSLYEAEEAILRAVDDDGLWRWESGEIPIWMTYDGLSALRAIALALYDSRLSGE